MPRRLWCVGVAVPLVALATTVRAQPHPLRLVLACSQVSGLTFGFAIQNVSAGPTAAVIGTILANDQKYLLERLEMIIRRAGVPADIKLKYVDGSVPGIAGRADPWLIMLPPGASYSVTVPAQNFRLAPNLEEEPFSIPADIQLHLTTQEIGRPNSDVEGLRFIHVWVETLASNWIRLPSDCSPDRQAQQR